MAHADRLGIVRGCIPHEIDSVTCRGCGNGVDLCKLASFFPFTGPLQLTCLPDDFRLKIIHRIIQCRILPGTVIGLSVCEKHHDLVAAHCRVVCLHRICLGKNVVCHIQANVLAGIVVICFDRLNGIPDYSIALGGADVFQSGFVKVIGKDRLIVFCGCAAGGVIRTVRLKLAVNVQTGTVCCQLVIVFRSIAGNGNTVVDTGFLQLIHKVGNCIVHGTILAEVEGHIMVEKITALNHCRTGFACSKGRQFAVQMGGIGCGHTVELPGLRVTLYILNNVPVESSAAVIVGVTVVAGNAAVSVVHGIIAVYVTMSGSAVISMNMVGILRRTIMIGALVALSNDISKLLDLIREGLSCCICTGICHLVQNALGSKVLHIHTLLFRIHPLLIALVIIQANGGIHGCRLVNGQNDIRRFHDVGNLAGGIGFQIQNKFIQSGVAAVYSLVHRNGAGIQSVGVGHCNTAFDGSGLGTLHIGGVAGSCCFGYLVVGTAGQRKGQPLVILQAEVIHAGSAFQLSAAAGSGHIFHSSHRSVVIHSLQSEIEAAVRIGILNDILGNRQTILRQSGQVKGCAEIRLSAIAFHIEPVEGMLGIIDIAVNFMGSVSCVSYRFLCDTIFFIDGHKHLCQFCFNICDTLFLVCFLITIINRFGIILFAIAGFMVQFRIIISLYQTCVEIDRTCTSCMSAAQVHDVHTVNVNHHIIVAREIIAHTNIVDHAVFGRIEGRMHSRAKPVVDACGVMILVTGFRVGRNMINIDRCRSVVCNISANQAVEREEVRNLVIGFISGTSICIRCTYAALNIISDSDLGTIS